MILDILYGGWLSAPNGASSVVRSLKGNAQLFREVDIEPIFWSLDNFRPRSFDYVPNKRHSKFAYVRDIGKKTIRNTVNALSRKNILFAKLFFQRGMSFCEEVANYYILNSINDGSKVLVHDLFTCYYYLKNRKHEQPTYLVLHNNGDTFSMHLEYHPCLNGSKFLYELETIEKFVLKNVDGVIFVAQNPKDNFLRLHPEFDRAKAHFVHNGIVNKHIETATKTNQVIELVCIGSVSVRKGQDIIIDALKTLSEREREKMHITFVGDGPLKPQLESISNKYSLPVSFVGFSKDIDKYLAKSDIFLLTSRDEGFPISILEAERAGLPILSTKVAGIPEMVENNINGILINPSVKDLADVFKNIKSYNWDEMGTASRNIYMKNFTMDVMIKNYIKLFVDTH